MKKLGIAILFSLLALTTFTAPVQVSLMPSVQTINKNDSVTGLSWNILAGEHASTVGVEFGLVNMLTESLQGVQIGAYNQTNLLSGVQAGLVNRSVSGGGAQLGLANSTDTLHGTQIGLINSSVTMYGVQIGLVNISHKITGAQIGILNTTDLLYGMQFGAVNIHRANRIPTIMVSYGFDF